MRNKMGRFLKLKEIVWALGTTLACLTLGGPVFADGFTLSPGRKAYDLQNYEQAKELFQQKLQNNPADADDAYALGNSLYRLGQYEDAAQAYEKALQQNPNLEPGWYNLGNSLFQQQEYQDAVDAYQKALALKPGDEDAKHNLQLAQEKLKTQPKNKKKKDKKKDTKDKKNNPSSDSSQNQPAQNQPGQNQPPSGSQNQGNQQSKSGSPQNTPGPSPKDSKNPSGSSGSSSASSQDQQRQAQAKKELGLSDGQVQALLEKMQKQEHQTQQYFSLNPKKDQQDNDPMWSLIPKEQRQLMQQLMGNKSQGSKNEPEEDW
jgi:Ca-activated chloride channel family protein